MKPLSHSPEPAPAAQVLAQAPPQAGWGVRGNAAHLSPLFQPSQHPLLQEALPPSLSRLSPFFQAPFRSLAPGGRALSPGKTETSPPPSPELQ